jgi:hypothetical protein
LISLLRSLKIVFKINSETATMLIKHGSRFFKH